MTTSTAPSPIDTIEQLTRQYARERSELADRISALEDDLAAAKRRRLRGIKGALARTQDAQDKLSRAIQAAPEYFRRPKTITVDGVRVGLMKAKGKISWDSPDRVVKLIRKHLPDQADTLIQTKESPIKPALGNLNTAQLRQIGCTITETGETVVIRPQDSEVDKLVSRLLEESSNLELDES